MFCVSPSRVGEDNAQTANRINAGKSHGGNFVISAVNHQVVVGVRVFFAPGPQTNTNNNDRLIFVL